MTSKEDSNKLLLFLYKELIIEKKDGIGPKNLVNEFDNWGPDRINFAYAYLRDNHYIKSISLPSNYNGVFDFWIQGLYPYAIKLVEDELENKKQEKLKEIFNQTPWENIKLIRKEENRAIFVDANIGTSNIIIGDTKINVCPGDLIERTYKGKKEVYVVVENGLEYEHDGIPNHYEIKVKKK